MRGLYRIFFSIACLLMFVGSIMASDFKVPRLSPLPVDLEEWKVSLNGE